MQLSNKAGGTRYLLGYNMHWINDKTFFYYVCKSAGLKKELDLQRFCSISAGFINAEQARKYAKSIADGLNFVIIYGASGEAVHTYSPSYDWSKNQGLH